MLPPPTLSFTIPSQHDGIALKCRIYHSRDPSAVVHWNCSAAIIAHPYAPLGGSMDDPVVGMLTSLCLHEGFVVGTFNFRGAAGSEGRTSWQSKAEQDDYMSFVGFMAYYMHHLYFSLRRPDQSSPSHLELDDLCPQHVSAPPRDEGTASQSMPHPRLLLGGYSYGALITISLPATVQAILAPFQSAVAGSTYAEIRRQAENFAHEQSQIVKGQKMIETLRSSPRLQSLAPNQGAAKKGRLPDNQYLNSNSQSPISSELVTGHIQSSDRLVESIAHSAGADQSEVNSNTAQAIVKDYQVAYLLISPLCGIVSDLLTLWTFKTEKNHNDLTGKSKKLQTCPTLAIYGDDDVFVSTENLRSWAETLSQSRSGHDRNQFRYVEIPGASHFWREPECIESLQAEVIAFIKSLK